VIVGGMTFGTLLTLFVVPTAYTLLAGRAVHHEPASAPTPAAPLPGAPVSGHAD
jgi:multidrug efflux pump